MSTGSQGPSGASADDWFFEQLDDETMSAFDPDVGFGPDDLAGVEVTTLDITTSEMAAVNHTARVDAGSAYAGPAYAGETEVGDLYAGGGPAGNAPPIGIEDERARSRPGRLMLGLALLAAERVRPGPPGEAFLAGVGLLQQSATGARLMVRRAMSPPVRMATRAVGWAAWLPGAETSRRTLSRSRERVGRAVLDARRLGAATVAAGRTDAAVFVQQTVSDGLAWAQAQAVPQIVNGLVPQLVDEVVPRIIDGALPEIRERVLPVVIQDLTTDPQVRDLVREQGMGVVGEAAQHLRTTTSGADDRIESAFRRMVRNPQPGEDEDEAVDEAGTAPGPADNSTDTSHG
jgi:hypothetical protein